MVRFVFAVALAGCASHAATGPAWPKPHASEDDGGESLAPHEAHGAAAEIEHSDDDAKPSTDPAAPAAAAPAASSEPAPPAAAAPTQPSEDTIIIDDVIINVDD